MLPKSCTLPVPGSCSAAGGSWARLSNSGLINRWILEVPFAGGGRVPGVLQVCVKAQTFNVVIGKNLWPWTGT